ncbi:MAG: hypothetical protein WCQ50_05405 [Spirochaetota bacterium]
MEAPAWLEGMSAATRAIDVFFSLVYNAAAFSGPAYPGRPASSLQAALR